MGGQCSASDVNSTDAIGCGAVVWYVDAERRYCARTTDMFTVRSRCISGTVTRVHRPSVHGNDALCRASKP